MYQWEGEFGAGPPYAIGPDSLFVAFSANAELSCHLTLGWPMPEHVLDLYVEARRIANGKRPTEKLSLQQVLRHYGLPEVGEKAEARNLIQSGGPWSASERQQILDYCARDVSALEQLLPRMLPEIPKSGVLRCGRYMRAVAVMEDIGIPIDVETYARLMTGWDRIKDRLVADLNTAGVYQGTTFKRERFVALVDEHEIQWPRLKSGAPKLDGKTFQDMATAHPVIAGLADLRSALTDLRRLSLEVGSDGRNRTSLMPFWTKSARNQPGSTKFIFAPSKWFRGLVKPTPGHGLAYSDYSQQELAIGAALSGDQAMMEAYLSRDFYLEFARQAGAIPDDTPEEGRGIIRAAYKTCALGVLYGMGRNLLAARTGKTIDEAARLLGDHRRSFRRFWEWNDEIICRARTAGCIETNRGWRLHVTSTEPNDCTLKNFPMQAHGAEMMREAACLAIEAGIRVCAPIHDAFLIEAPVDGLDCEIERMRACMAAASREILDGFEVRTDLKVVRYPDRLMEPEGRAMWDKVMTLLEEVEWN